MQIIENQLSVEDYRNMRKVSGLSEKTLMAAEIALKNTLHSVAILNDNKVIGIGRIVGDGGAFAQVVDVCVHPDFQRRGVGKMIMENLMSYINTLPTSCYISLLADGDAKYLYEKYGFKETAPDSVGMAIKI
ncbi:MAG: N-acetyltransferase [Chryseobacterium sp.]|uniref:GNAT family N-acetyltransferase n=1 Tax=Chryseobacterium sp. TaxID=1871047 RepID=UPI000DB5A954|nr:GNAT family N-acetyltransferase [Chryseobacterium sp.]MPS63795.1 N-acetyltransferase [Chryseobacterium sp.]PZU25216.1 MAG: N-acetyltransferase [Chryseobacterium sp.]